MSKPLTSGGAEIRTATPEVRGAGAAPPAIIEEPRPPNGCPSCWGTRKKHGTVYCVRGKTRYLKCSCGMTWKFVGELPGSVFERT